MYQIPEVLITEIISFLPLSFIFTNVIFISKSFYQEVFSPHMLDSILKINFRLSSPIRVSPHICLCIMKERFTKRAQLLDFRPISTDGGSDEDRENYWFGHAFEYNDKPWCTLEGMVNVNASAVLANTQQEKIGYYWANKEAVNIVRNWLASRGKKLYKKNEHIATAIFNHVVTNFPLDAITIDEQNPEELREKIRNIFLNLRPLAQGIEKQRRFAEKNNFLDMEFDREAANSSNVFAAISSLCISRKGGFTCPVKTLMIFVSFSDIDIMDPVLKLYNDMKEYDTLAGVHEINNLLPLPREIVKKNGFKFCEFGPCKERLKPVLWDKFRKNQRADEIEIKLKEEVSAKYFYVKLVEPEDRRAERHWNHDLLNIDCKYVVPKGRILTLS